MMFSPMKAVVCKVPGGIFCVREGTGCINYAGTKRQKRGDFELSFTMANDKQKKRHFTPPGARTGNNNYLSRQRKRLPLEILGAIIPRSAGPSRLAGLA
ncbi:hypothetical protein AVEN_92315-1 [Araneus ventricosus]|uniref:Uncharacterized protein n=1 Tax=Araneus ventricosus TaxID=182803 RepID=A0A4Y2AMD3_ARAVE|nr:hypothetical protein AVEN_92315-1 [Araneus ventricosus]